MQDAWELFRGAGTEALWRRCLGFFDLSLEQTMAIQHRLLGEQLVLLDASPLGRALFGAAHPRTIEDLRETVPLSTYEDYASTLGERREDLLPQRPRTWIKTSGRENGGERWYPVSPQQYEQLSWLAVAMPLASGARERGHVFLTERSRFLNFFPPPTYISGLLARALEGMWPLRSYPGPELDSIDYHDRNREAVLGAVDGGVDLVASLAAVMPRIGAELGSGSGEGQRELMHRPRTLARLARGRARALAAGRPMYPRDLWSVGGLVTGGLDSGLFRERIRETWGRYPLDTLINTEAGVIGFQGWDLTTLTMVPYLNFFEFLPDDELERERLHSGYQPRSILTDELSAGRNYELVVTNLLGGPMVRFRTGDIVRVTAIGNVNLGSELPQIVHYGRRGSLLEIGGFVRLTETAIGQAIADAGLDAAGWSARKEVEGNEPVVHVRLEPASDPPPHAEAVARLDEALGRVDQNWADMAEIAGLRALRLTLLPAGSFARYSTRTNEGGGRLRAPSPVVAGMPRLNPDDHAIETLIAAGQGE